MGHETDGDRLARLGRIREACAMPNTPDLESHRFLLAELERVEKERDEARTVECTNCAFRYGAEHVRDTETPEDVCPCCAESRLERDLAAAQARVRGLEGVLRGADQLLFNRIHDWLEAALAAPKEGT